MLPQVINGKDFLRQNFIKKSGLDLFYIEELRW